MTSANFRSVFQQRPFRPFAIRTASGETFQVAHPELAWSPPDSDVVLVSSRGADGVTISMLDLALISEVVYSAPVARSGSPEE